MPPDSSREPQWDPQEGPQAWQPLCAGSHSLTLDKEHWQLRCQAIVAPRIVFSPDQSQLSLLAAGATGSMQIRWFCSEWVVTMCPRRMPRACLQLVINEISTSSPQALQAIKLLAQYQGAKLPKVSMPPKTLAAQLAQIPAHQTRAPGAATDRLDPKRPICGSTHVRLSAFTPRAGTQANKTRDEDCYWNC